jgi:hypothetical protein
VAITAIKPVRQRAKLDCAIAAIGTLLGLDYEVVLDAAKRVCRRLPKDGLNADQIRKTIRALGCTVSTKRKFGTDEEYIGEETGLVVVKVGTCEHVVVAFNGSIYDPQEGVFYDPDGYLKPGWSFGLLWRVSR